MKYSADVLEFVTDEKRVISDIPRKFIKKIHNTGYDTAVCGGACLYTWLHNASAKTRNGVQTLDYLKKKSTMGDIDLWVNIPEENHSNVFDWLTEFGHENPNIAWSHEIVNQTSCLDDEDYEEDFRETLHYRWLFVHLGVYKIMNINFYPKSRNALTITPRWNPIPTVQLVFLDNRRNKDIPLSIKVVSDFDIDVCKCFFVFDENGNITQVRFLSAAIERNVRQGIMNFIIRPCNTPKSIYKRLEKYKERGFNVQDISFSDRVSFMWKAFVEECFRRSDSTEIYEMVTMPVYLKLETLHQLKVENWILPNGKDVSFLEDEMSDEDTEEECSVSQSMFPIAP